MSEISISKATYDLAFEYMKENQMLKISSDNTLNKRMEEFEKAYNEIYSVLDTMNILKCWLSVFIEFRIRIRCTLLD